MPATFQTVEPDGADASAPPPPARLIWSASETCADLLYLSGFPAPDAFLWFRTPDETAIVVSALEVGRARKQASEGVRVYAWSDLRDRLGLPETARLEPGTVVPRLAEHIGIRRWGVPEAFPLGVGRKLEAAGLDLTVVDPFVPERARKREDEVDRIREGVRLAEAGLAAALQRLRNARIGPDGILVETDGEPLTAEALRGEIAARIARLGGTASHTIAAPGPQSSDPHCTGTGPIRSGEPVIIDIFPRVDRSGYHGDLTRTVVKGTAPDRVRKAFDAVRAAREEAIQTIGPGTPAADVHRTAADRLQAAGFPTDKGADPPTGFFHGLGHGLGLEVHEAPRVSGTSDARLEAGHVVTVEPGVYYPEWGGIRLEDVVVVTESGCENLTVAPTFLELE